MIGKTILHYKIIKKLGEGGMGVVYLAEDTKLERQVAIKFLPHHIAGNSDERKRFEIEAKAAAALNHPNIATIFAIEESDNQLFLVMEYISGKHLKEHINLKPLSIDEAIDIAIQIAKGLQAAHAKGIVHRDIKSANIMSTEDGQVKIMDFGLAKIRGSVQLTQVGTTLGTAAYMSPEQARGEDVDHQSDIWSFGVVLYEILTGELPFKGDYEAAVTYSIVNEEPVTLNALRAEISRELGEIVKKTLQKITDDRYSSADELLNELDQLQGSAFTKSSGKQISRPIIIMIVIIVTMAIVSGSWWLNQRYSQLDWVREKGFPELHQLIESERFFSALRLAEEISQIVPDDPALIEVWPQLSSSVLINTSEPGAKVYIKPYTSLEDNDWKYFGVTPIKNIRIPRGLLHWKIEKVGFETIEFAVSGQTDQLIFDLQVEGSVPAGMVKIPSDSIESSLIGMPEWQPVSLDVFFIDKFEVTNQQYKKFVDAGGYKKLIFWKFPFFKSNKEISWQEAVKEFSDATGRAGPVNWELGSYPEGKGDHPVSGISWYEAAAYAEFVEKELPTVFHWIKASSHPARGDFLPQSNYGSEDTAPVGKHQNIGFYGTYDMAGNVREWCFNQSAKHRFVLGGSWNDPSYMFSYADHVSPFNRSLQNGFRCIKIANKITVPTEAYDSVSLPPIRDYKKETPVSDEIFAVYKRLYDYDKTELKAIVESVDSTAKFWRKEKITFNTGYGNERMAAYLFLPKNGKTPFQTIIIFPGSNGILSRNSDNHKNLNSFDAVDFTIKSGRAVVYPVYKLMYERGDKETAIVAFEAKWTEILYRDTIIKWRKDLGRTIDYLSTRPDIDPDKLCYYGSSLGASLSPIFLTLEERIKLAIFRLGGFELEEIRPEVDPFNFASHVRVPVLMLNGKYDVLFPLKESQQPLFDLWGVPEDQKRMVHFNMGHSIPRPRNQVIKETLDWLDRYFGEVAH